MSTPKKVLLGLLILAVVGVFGAVGFVYFVDSKIDKIPDEELPSLVEETEQGFRNILIVGSDSRENLPEGFDNFGSFSGSRTDVIMVAHVIPGEGAQLLSLPRDLKMEIPGNGTNRINAAFVFGGPDLLVQTIQNNLGIPINHYVEIDFGGFATVVESLGGITKTFANDARDLKSGLDVEAGTQQMNGETALAYARSRSYQELINGSWKSVDGSDIGRTHRQQEVLLLMFDQATSKSAAFSLPSFATTFAEQIRADSGFTPAVMIDLGRAALALSSANIETMTLPVVNSMEGGVAYVVPIEPAATTVLGAFMVGDPFPEL
ncbi:MAG: LCP family protein [Acidimicrobiia bacterium]|nr:LCP family protein [Acidimicrobiia bacterium]MDX2465876.1 LCP family protein [Acidimicrobiia bacterium]